MSVAGGSWISVQPPDPLVVNCKHVPKDAQQAKPCMRRAVRRHRILKQRSAVRSSCLHGISPAGSCRTANHACERPLKATYGNDK
jgi:hypothetical protein